MGCEQGERVLWATMFAFCALMLVMLGSQPAKAGERRPLGGMVNNLQPRESGSGRVVIRDQHGAIVGTATRPAAGPDRWTVRDNLGRRLGTIERTR